MANIITTRTKFYRGTLESVTWRSQVPKSLAIHQLVSNVFGIIPREQIALVDPKETRFDL